MIRRNLKAPGLTLVVGLTRILATGLRPDDQRRSSQADQLKLGLRDSNSRPPEPHSGAPRNPFVTHHRLLVPHPTHRHPHPVLVRVGPGDDDPLTVEGQHGKPGGARNAGCAHGNGR